jgi:2-oxo-3-hexenedioate decarboxylase
MLATEIQQAARYLDQARLDAREVARLTEKYPELTMPDAYLIHDEGIRFRVAQGEKVIGLKMGLTSKAKREQMNLKSPCYGTLTDKMQLQDGDTLSLEGSIHPKIEPEIAFITARELSASELRKAPDPLAAALAACSHLCAAMEILDSRFVGFKYFSLPDVVADNSSSSLFILSGKLHLPGEFTAPELATLAMDLQVGGKTAQRDLSAAISGNPLQSLIQLCELLEERGQRLPAGSIVLAGAATQAVQLEPGMKVRLEVARLGAVELSVRQ